MRFLSETRALEKLSEIREGFREAIDADFGFRAKDCRTCEFQGVCCTDEHFVNVRITRLEAAAIMAVIDTFDEAFKDTIHRRIGDAARNVSAGSEFFACPLYEKGLGCLVHKDAKPLPCIFHACYESLEQLPPDHLLDEAESDVAGLNKRVYGYCSPALQIPSALASRLGINSDGADARREPSSDTTSEQI